MQTDNQRPPDGDVLSIWIDNRRARAQIPETTGNQDEAVTMLRSLLPYAATLSRMVPLDGREANTHQILISALQSSRPEEAIGHARLAVAGFTKLMRLDPADVDTGALREREPMGRDAADYRHGRRAEALPRIGPAA